METLLLSVLEGTEKMGVRIFLEVRSDGVMSKGSIWNMGNSDLILGEYSLFIFIIIIVKHWTRLPREAVNLHP